MWGRARLGKSAGIPTAVLECNWFWLAEDVVAEGEGPANTPETTGQCQDKEDQHHHLSREAPDSVLDPQIVEEAMSPSSTNSARGSQSQSERESLR